MNCKHCGIEIKDNHVRIGDFCMGCEGTEIDVYRVRIAEEKGASYIDKNPDNIKDMLTECEVGDGYTITKERMKVIQYYNLPEFIGF